MAQKVLSVGQCGADSYGLRLALLQEFEVSVEACDTAEEVVTALHAGTYALVLVNRIFDRNGDSGLDLIRRLKRQPELAATPLMLVSNFAASQRDAVAAGALPGFGKAELGEPKMIECVRAALARK